ncbi:MAG: asparagine synthase (glutamine-hydrolyzing) [Chloroflexaceae bacterium]|nr:asparagine synthase (glutamine-hydrolyzing) [Chloroflexaceae bacterium]
MCGIVGIAAQQPQINTEYLSAMRDTMGHRGPDSAGVWWSTDRRMGLGHRRLAIIDLSDAGHQPMSDLSGSLWLVFNGEIYNYRSLRRELEWCGYPFMSESDSEVLLQAYRAWGHECLEHLNGMFAFGLYDSNKRGLLLARDRAGEKPLFYYQRQGRLVFASELKALLADPSLPRRLDRRALQYYLAYGYVPAPWCLLQGVRKLCAGEALWYELDSDQSRTWRYWRVPEPYQQTAPEDDAALLEELDVLLRDSVRLRLHADVPVGLLLSGGVDSSLVTAIAAEVATQPVRTFTVTFPGAGHYNEATYARQVACAYGTEHHELVAEPASVELLPMLAAQYDEPMADSSLLPTYLVSQMIRSYATVALGGDGGDELFGGYVTYGRLHWRQYVDRLLPFSLRMLAGVLAADLLPLGLKGRNYALALLSPLPLSNLQINAFFDAAARRRLLTAADGRWSGVDLAPEWHTLAWPKHSGSLLQQATAIDFQTYLVDDILVKVDRASMLTSLEVRSPWLDHRLIEFALGRLPDRLRATPGKRKILLRQLAQRLLPSTLNLERKQGFSLPLARWLQGCWGDYVQEVLDEADPTLFDPAAIQQLIDWQRRGGSHSERLFALTMFELWRRHYTIQVTS